MNDVINCKSIVIKQQKLNNKMRGFYKNLLVIESEVENARKNCAFWFGLIFAAGILSLFVHPVFVRHVMS
jgi:hypothetical protein